MWLLYPVLPLFLFFPISYILVLPFCLSLYLLSSVNHISTLSHFKFQPHTQTLALVEYGRAKIHTPIHLNRHTHTNSRPSAVVVGRKKVTLHRSSARSTYLLNVCCGKWNERITGSCRTRRVEPRVTRRTIHTYWSMRVNPLSLSLVLFPPRVMVHRIRNSDSQENSILTVHVIPAHNYYNTQEENVNGRGSEMHPDNGHGFKIHPK